MNWIRIIGVVGAILLCAMSNWAQEAPPKSKIVSDLSAEVAGATYEPRDKAQHELFADYERYEPPNIATSLADPLSFIAFVTEVRVKLPEGPGSPYTEVTLHVDQLLRGATPQTELQAESRWQPPAGYENEMARIFSGMPGTAFDYTEPKAGNRFLVGFPFLDVDRGRAHIFGAIDISDHDEAELVLEVQRFLGIESAASGSNFAPFVGALSDHVAWIRDLAAQRLVQSEACNASRGCQEALLTSAQNLLHSRKPGERWEALQWLDPLALPMGERQEGPNGLPPMANSAVRALLVSATSDPNLWIADEAFRKLELFDFFHEAGPGECITVFPTIRKSVRLLAPELQGISISGTVACTPAEQTTVE
jgi:hypothetical protein